VVQKACRTTNPITPFKHDTTSLRRAVRHFKASCLVMTEIIST